jgi:hypothetical protein
MAKKKTNAGDAGKRTGLSFPTRLFGTAQVITSAYDRGGGCAVELVDGNGEPITMLSVNLPEFAPLLGDGEFFAKTWSENEEIAKDALFSGIFRNTGRTGGGIVNAQIWTFR